MHVDRAGHDGRARDASSLARRLGGGAGREDARRCARRGSRCRPACAVAPAGSPAAADEDRTAHARSFRRIVPLGPAVRAEGAGESASPVDARHGVLERLRRAGPPSVRAGVGAEFAAHVVARRRAGWRCRRRRRAGSSACRRQASDTGSRPRSAAGTGRLRAAAIGCAAASASARRARRALEGRGRQRVARRGAPRPRSAGSSAPRGRRRVLLGSHGSQTIGARQAGASADRSRRRSAVSPSAASATPSLR